MRRSWGPAAAIALRLAGYVGLALLLTWPLGAHIATHLPQAAGHFVSDLYYVGWALAWQTHALTTTPSAFANANIYGGAPLALFYGTPGFGLLPLYAPLFAATGNPTLALNVTLLVELALTATALHVVTRSWTGSELAGIAAGTTFLTSKAALVMCAIMPQYAALAAMPVIVWWLARPRLDWGATIGLAALVALQGLTDVIYVALPVALVMSLVAAPMLARAPTRTRGLRVLAALGLAAIALSPVYAGYLAVRVANPDLRTQSVWTGTFLEYVDERTGLPLGFGPLALDPMALLPAIVGFVVGLVGIVDVAPDRRRAWRHVGLWFFAGWMIAWVIPMQYPTFREIVLHSVVRDFMRLGLGALIAACLLTGLGFAACVAAATMRLRPAVRPVVAGALIALVVALRIGHARWAPGEYPTGPAPTPGPEAAILRGGTGPVLVLPVGDPRKDSGSHAAAMYRSIGHWRPLLNGYCSYYPRGFRERVELIRRLPDGRVLDTLRHETHLTNIVVHSIGFPELTIGRWRNAIASGSLPGVRIDHDDGDVLVLAVDSMGW
jgi:hypothetical protein